MAQIFGENSTGQINPDNPLGVTQAPEVAASTGEPEGNSAAGQVVVGEDNVSGGEGQINQAEPQAEPQEEKIEHVSVNDDYDRKVAYIKQKFNSGEELEKAIRELAQKLGRNIDDVDIKTAEEAIDYYIELETELGRTSNIDETRQENQRLKEEVQGLRNYVQQMNAYLQSLQMQGQGQNQIQGQGQNYLPPRDPNTGRFISPNQLNQNQGQANNEGFKLPDTDEWMEQFYEKGPQAVVDLIDAKMNELMQKQQQLQQQQLQQQEQARALKMNFDNQVNMLKQQYGEEEFNKYKQGMLQVFQEYPMYLNPQLFPNGFDIAFREARRRQNDFYQQQTTNNSQDNNALKKAAQMPKSAARFPERKPSQEEIEKMMIFNSPEKKQGIFG